jgi:hypothetical protein
LYVFVGVTLLVLIVLGAIVVAQIICNWSNSLILEIFVYMVCWRRDEHPW